MACVCSGEGNRPAFGGDVRAFDPSRFAVVGVSGDPDGMQVLLDEVLAQHRAALVADGERYIKRHCSRGKMLVRERTALLVDRDSALIELHTLEARGTGDPVGAGEVNAIGLSNGFECFIEGTDMTARAARRIPRR